MDASASTTTVTVADRINTLARKLPTWPLYVIAAVPPIYLLYLALQGRLGVEPVEVMEHKLGLWSLQLLIAGLCITPIRMHLRINLIKFRRALGLIAFTYVFLHLSVWLFLDVQIWSEIWADIVKRPYVTIGMAAFVLLIPLAATSSQRIARAMGAKAWKRLHKLTYIIVVLGAVHWMMLTRGWQLEPVLYFVTVIVVLAARVRPGRMMERLQTLNKRMRALAVR